MFSLEHLNQINNPFSSSPTGPGLRTGDPGAFEELLRRAQTSARTDSTEPASSHPPGWAGSVGSRSVQIDRTSELFEMCLELETFLVKNLISGMRNTIERSNLIDIGFAGKIYEDMLFDEYSSKITRNAGFGFAEMAYLELTGQR
jgi:flagellar protein FlgJ